jgi:ATP-dependent helicase HrpA
VMAAELVETTRLWAHTVARVEPEWAEALAGHLVRRSYGEPRWDPDRGAVVADERVTLFGLPIVARRQVNYGRIDPRGARELFIRRALVEGDWRTRHRFFHDNRRLLEEVEDLEDRARRRDLLVDDEALFAFYDRRVGQEVVSARHFDAWWKRAGREQPDLLDFEKSMLLREGAEGVDQRDYPDEWRQDGLTLRLTYQFEPGADADGVTVHVPVAVLNQLDGGDFQWQVPGLREELVTALLRSLPKPLRRNLVPAADHARAVLQRLRPRQEPLLEALARELQRTAAVAVPADALRLDRVPDHLKVSFRVVDERGRTLAEGKDLEALRRRLQGRMRAVLAAAGDGLEPQALSDWTFGTLPRTVESRRGGRRLRAWPALVDEGDSVAVRLLESEDEQQRATWRGTRRLLLLQAPSPVRHVLGRLPARAKLTLSRYPHGSATELFEDCVACAVDALIAEHGGPPWDRQGFAALRDAVRARLPAVTLEVATEVARILEAAGELEERLARTTGPGQQEAADDVRAQLAGLVYPGFVAATGKRRLPDLPRYLRAAARRLERLPRDPLGDRERMRTVQRLARTVEELAGRPAADRPPAEALEELRWMLEELRVSYFAQQLGTPYPVSEQRFTAAARRVAERR